MTVANATLVGNLGQDPELRQTHSGTAVCNLRVATSSRRKGPDGEWGDVTEWWGVTVFGKQAELCDQYLTKGRLVYVDGELQRRTWTDREGAERVDVEVIARTVRFLGAAPTAPEGQREQCGRGGGGYGGRR